MGQGWWRWGVPLTAVLLAVGVIFPRQSPPSPEAGKLGGRLLSIVDRYLEARNDFITQNPRRGTASIVVMTPEFRSQLRRDLKVLAERRHRLAAVGVRYSNATTAVRALSFEVADGSARLRISELTKLAYAGRGTPPFHGYEIEHDVVFVRAHEGTWLLAEDRPDVAPGHGPAAATIVV